MCLPVRDKDCVGVNVSPEKRFSANRQGYCTLPSYEGLNKLKKRAGVKGQLGGIGKNSRHRRVFYVTVSCFARIEGWGGGVDALFVRSGQVAHALFSRFRALRVKVPSWIGSEGGSFFNRKI
jgi:hypothetical protein